MSDFIPSSYKSRVSIDPRTNPDSGQEGTKTRCLGIATSRALTAW